VVSGTITKQGAFRAGDAGTIAGFFSEEVTEYLHRLLVNFDRFAGAMSEWRLI
jgi:hypothetical protein